MRANNRRNFLFIPLALALLWPIQVPAQSGPECRRTGIMDGNLVKTVYGNWGVIGQPAQRGRRGAWIHPNNGYVGDVSILVGAEVVAKAGARDTTFHSVVVCPVDRPASGGPEQSPTGKRWGFEPLCGYFNPDQQEVAISNKPNTWPGFWPDRLDDATDPGWRGAWNGYFGRDQFSADLETYFVMDDNNDEEFNVAANNRWGVAFQPDSRNPSRNGLGLEVRVRALQWNDVLAQDNIFWLYEITNQGTTNYSRVAFGSLVGTYVGVTSIEDRREYDDDFSFFDVERDLTYTADFDDNVTNRNPNWVGEVGVVGYAFLESPGNPFDGIDNDGDADHYPTVPFTAPEFHATDFDSVLISAGKQIVLITNEGKFTRTVVTVPNRDTTFISLGRNFLIRPGRTKLIEGNTYRPPGQAREIVNPNAFDGFDNDLDGLIDENSQLHYRQVRRDQTGRVLFDRLNPLRHVDYVTGRGVRDHLLDERRDDGIDNDNDWDIEFDDVGLDGAAGTGDFGEGDGLPTSGAGTNLPGEPHIDKTDVDESDQIGLSSFEYFAPAGNFSIRDDESLWQRLTPGFFDVPPSIVNNKPQQGEDGDFIFSSGFFPLSAGQTERFSLALVYGAIGGPDPDIGNIDLLKNLETVQKIYNSNYQFPIAPRKPVVQAFADDGKVTLTWDSKAEESIDPVTREKDFEGYKVYRSTDPEFNDARIITNADGTLEQLKPIAQFDLNNGISGYFQAQGGLYQDLRGSSFFLGNDTGLQRSFVDRNVENGRTYYYAVVAYDRGDANADIFPKENTHVIRTESGIVETDVNTVVVTPRAKVAGYTHPEGSVPLTPIKKFATGDVNYQVLDEQSIVDHIYTLEFFDTSSDGLDNNGNWNVATDDLGSDGKPGTNDPDGTENNGKPDVGEPNIDRRDAKELFEKFTTSYSVKDSTGISEGVLLEDNVFINLSRQNIVPGSVTLRNPSGAVVPDTSYILRYDSGRIRPARPGSLPAGQYSIRYQYYPVFRSTRVDSIQRQIPSSSTAPRLSDTDNFDGLALSFRNFKAIVKDDGKSRFNRDRQPFFFSFAPLELNLGNQTLLGFRHAADYRFEFSNNIVDTSSTLLGATPIPTNYRIFNVTDNRYIDFLLLDRDNNGRTISTFDEIVLVEPGSDNAPTPTWDMVFSSTKDTTITFGPVDTLFIVTSKPFRRGDLFTFKPEKPAVEAQRARAEVNRIRVVPNPYVVSSTHEPPLPPGVTSGRGERRITFTRVPAGATIHVFTARGELVRTLNHDNDIQNGSVTWNLKTFENLDIAPGIYFYVVDSSMGQEKGKIAIVK